MDTAAGPIVPRPVAAAARRQKAATLGGAPLDSCEGRSPSRPWVPVVRTGRPPDRRWTAKAGSPRRTPDPKNANDKRVGPRPSAAAGWRGHPTQECEPQQPATSSGGAGSPADTAVPQFTDQIGMPVVACVLLDHVDIDPPQRARLPVPQTGVVQRMGPGRSATGVALGLPGGQVGFPVGIIEGDQFAVLDGGVVPDRRCETSSSSTRRNQLRSTSAR